MQGPKQEDSDEVVSAINITPLCDILVVLLIIFMVTAQAEVLQGPKVAAPAEPENTMPIPEVQAQSVSITIDQDGFTSMNGTMVSLDKLAGRLREELPKTTKEQVMIRAFHGLSLERVMQVVEAAERAGAKGIGIGTQLR